MIISYEIFRILTKSEENEPLKKIRNANVKLTHKNKHFQRLQVEFRKYLQSPGYFFKYLFFYGSLGPHLIICDEGHKLKSDETSLFKTMNKIKTSRRLCLTGTPMQNNLKECKSFYNF